MAGEFCTYADPLHPAANTRPDSSRFRGLLPLCGAPEGSSPRWRRTLVRLYNIYTSRVAQNLSSVDFRGHDFSICTIIGQGSSRPIGRHAVQDFRVYQMVGGRTILVDVGLTVLAILLLSWGGLRIYHAFTSRTGLHCHCLRRMQYGIARHELRSNRRLIISVRITLVLGRGPWLAVHRRRFVIEYWRPRSIGVSCCRCDARVFWAAI